MKRVLSYYISDDSSIEVQPLNYDSHYNIQFDKIYTDSQGEYENLLTCIKIAKKEKGEAPVVFLQHGFGYMLTKTYVEALRLS